MLLIKEKSVKHANSFCFVKRAVCVCVSVCVCACVWLVLSCVWHARLHLTCFHSYLLSTHITSHYTHTHSSSLISKCLSVCLFLVVVVVSFMDIFHAFIRLIDINICQNIWNTQMTPQGVDRH